MCLIPPSTSKYIFCPCGFALRIIVQYNLVIYVAMLTILFIATTYTRRLPLSKYSVIYLSMSSVCVCVCVWGGGGGGGVVVQSNTCNCICRGRGLEGLRSMVYFGNLTIKVLWFYLYSLNTDFRGFRC